MAAHEHVSPELIVNVLGKKYFTAKKKQHSRKKELDSDQNVYILDEIFKLLVELR